MTYAPETRWTEATLYGVGHSPWVQGVHLALTYHRLRPRLTSYPLSPSWFAKSGFIFPALRLKDGSTHLDSFAIFRALEKEGYPMGLSGWAQPDQDAAQAELEALFMRYALGRCTQGKKWEFIKGWASMKEEQGSALGTVSRALGCHYFWLLINLGIFDARRRGFQLYNLDEIEGLLQQWDGRLLERQWLTAEAPGFLDFALLGHLQCMTSGLTDELLPILRRQQGVMRWLRELLATFKPSGSMFAQRLLDPEHEVTLASPNEQRLFWASWALWLSAWPVTAPLLALGFARRGANPAHSGAVSRRHKRQKKRHT